MKPPPPDALRVPVIEEQLDIRRRRVDSGRPVRLRKEVLEEQAPVRVALELQAVRIDRVPKDQVLDAWPQVRQEGEVTVVPVVRERLVTRKELVLVEEIRLTRRTELTPFETEVCLRRERVTAERFDPDSGQWRPEPDRPADPPTHS
jgi:uncharacterized protein (TIGR02271 family)